MEIFDKPENLNGVQLRDELNAAGVNIDYGIGQVIENNDNTISLNINAKDKTKALSIVATHNGATIPVELTIEQKLASVGLNLGDLKTALGLA
jgi:hypothetical protein